MAGTLWSGGAALIGCRAGGCVSGIDRRAARQKRLGLGWAAIVGQRAKQRVARDQVARDCEAAGIAGQVVAQRRGCDRAGTERAWLALVAAVTRHDAVGKR